jgi:hypothetical protein
MIALTVEVSKRLRKHFWDKGDGEKNHWGAFWAFRKKPAVKEDDQVVFTFDGKPVALVFVDEIEAPRKSACEKTGKFKGSWKVCWNISSFIDLRSDKRSLAQVLKELEKK